MQPPRAKTPRRLGIGAVALLVASLGTLAQATPPLTASASADMQVTYAKVNNDPSFVQVYVNNVENLETVNANCPGDWQDLIYYMKTYATSPDLFLVQQISNRAELDKLVNTMTNRLAGVYAGILAVNPEPMKSPCGAEKRYQTNAIIYRTGRFNVVDRDTWQSDAVNSNGNCSNNHQDRTINLRAKLWDKTAQKHLTVATIHWPTGRSDGPPCAAENAREAAANVNAFGGSLMIWGGDTNISDQTSGGAWRGWYSKTNGDIGGVHGFRDVMYNDCEERHSSSSGIKDCLRKKWTIGSGRRIDFLFAKKGNGALPFVGAEHTVTFNEGDQADIAVTGTDRQDRNYSDHRAVRARIHY